MYRKKHSIHGSVLSMVLGIHWGFWNISPVDKGNYCNFCILYNKVRVQLYSSTCGYPIFPALCIEKTIFSQWMVLALLLKIIWPYMYGRVSFWTLCSISLVYMSVFMLVPHCFDDCSFVISFEIRECETSNFVLFFFSRLFWLLGVPWEFIQILGWIFLYLQKNAIGILIGIALNL